jgi:hypothetical protein
MTNPQLIQAALQGRLVLLPVGNCAIQLYRHIAMKQGLDPGNTQLKLKLKLKTHSNSLKLTETHSTGSMTHQTTLP